MPGLFGTFRRMEKAFVKEGRLKKEIPVRSEPATEGVPRCPLRDMTPRVGLVGRERKTTDCWFPIR